MRILVLTLYFPPEIGGAPTRLKCFTNELARCGCEVEVVTAMPNYPRGEFFPGYGKEFYRREVKDGMTIHRVWLHPAVGSGIKRLLNYLSFACTCLYGLWRARKPDYIFVESPPIFLSAPAYLAGLFWRVPFIFNVADLWPDAVVDGGFLKHGFVLRCLLALERWSYRRAAYVATVTEWIAGALQEKKGVPVEKILFLPNGVDIQVFRPLPPNELLRSKLNLDGKKVVLWAGTLGYAHGIENILHGAKLMEREGDIHFLFLGDGSAKKDLIQQKEQMGLSNVSFHDPVPFDEVPSFCSISYCGLASLSNISVNQGARPSKVLPVLATGKPLVFVGSGEGAEIVRKANAGRVVPQGDPKALARALLELARNAPLAVELGQNGRSFAEYHLQWSLLVERWLNRLGYARKEKAPGDDVSVASQNLTS